MPFADLFLDPLKKLLPVLYRHEDGRLRERRILWCISIVVGLFVYRALAPGHFPNLYALDRLREAFWPEPTPYTFYSGGPSGYYTRVGERLAALTTNGSAPLEVVNQETAGSLANLRSVAVERRAVALAQHDVMSLPEFRDARLRTVARVFTETMHVLYSKEAFARAAAATAAAAAAGPRADASGPLEAPMLSRHPAPATLRFLRDCTAYLGVPSGGTHLLASLALEQSGATPRRVVTSVGDMDDVFSRLSDGRLHLYFSVARAPLDEILAGLRGHEDTVGVMGIDPALTWAVGDALQSELCSVAYPDAYGKDLQPTLGTTAVLIASVDTPEPDLDWLRNVLRTEEAGGKKIVDEDFRAALPVFRSSRVLELLRSLLLFACIVLGVSLLSLTLLTGLLSSFKHANHYRHLSHTYSEYLPPNATLAPRELAPDPSEGRPADPEASVRMLVKGMREVLSRAALIRGDFETGGITVFHLRHLLDEVRTLKVLFQNNLFQRLLYARDEQDWTPGASALAHYQVCGYLRPEQRRELADGPMPGTDANDTLRPASRPVAGAETKPCSKTSHPSSSSPA